MCTANKTNCSLTQFQCNNKACIPSESVCNSIRDCTDNSDEYGCGVNECRSPVLNKCDHICRDTLTSFECDCRKGFKLLTDNRYRFQCIDINECKETPWVCSQLCENQPGSYNCKCASDYEKVAGGDVCKLVGPKIEANLLFTSNYYLRNISLETNNYNLIKSGFELAKGLAYNYNESYIYVLDSGSSQMLRLKINQSSGNNVLVNTQVLISNLHGDERGMAFDWISKKLYFLTNNRLLVSDSDGNKMATLLDNNVLQEANDIVLDPYVGYLFFTDWNYPAYIGRLGMDGSNFTKIINQDIGSPIGITLDLITKRIFWSDTHLSNLIFCFSKIKLNFI